MRSSSRASFEAMVIGKLLPPQPLPLSRGVPIGTGSVRLKVRRLRETEIDGVYCSSLTSYRARNPG